MNYKRFAAKYALIMAIISLGSKFLGFIRETLIASKFGAGMETDAYFIALTVTSLLAELIRTSLSTTLIPIFSEIEYKEGKKGKIKYFNNLFNIIIFMALIIIVLGWISSPLIIKILAKGFEGEQFKLAVKLIRIGMPSILFISLVGMITGYLNSEQIFISSAATGIPSNIILIFYLLTASSFLGIKGLMVTSVIASFSQVLIQIPSFKKSGWRYKFKVRINDKYIIRILELSVPVLIGVAINDLNAIVDRTLASSLDSGSISVLSYSNRLNVLILGVFITAITTVIFPVLSREANNDNILGVKNTMGYGVNLILLITIPATVGLIVLAKPIVEIAFQRGEFDATATMMTSQALIFYSVGLVAMALRLLITRVYYSLQDTKTPMINGAISVGFNIFLNLILVQYMGHAGLAFATSIATTIATILMFYGLKKKIGSLGTKSYIIIFIKSGLASAIMGVVAYSIYHELYGLLGVSKLHNLISLLAAVGIGVIVYGVLCYLLKVEEIRLIVKKVRQRLIKR